MNKKQKKMLVRILIAAALLIALNFIPAEGWIRFGLYLIPYLVIGYDILLKALKGIRNRQVFDECFLMAVRSEEHTSELQSRFDLVCRLLLEKKRNRILRSCFD